MSLTTDSLHLFHPTLQRWFLHAFQSPTLAQEGAWPAIARGDNTLLLAPTGSGKTLAAFLFTIDRLMFRGEAAGESVHTLYLSPLKALGVDVQRNLHLPIAAIRACAERENVPYQLPTVGVRSGDTPNRQRQQLSRRPPGILITTPESLYLMLTSRARQALAGVRMVIIDEIHSLVGNKRGAHLAVSLERLERLRKEAAPDTLPLQRIGLSATQRPLAEVARFLGGAEATHAEDEQPSPRPVQIVEAGRGKQLDLRVEVPVEDMTRLAQEQPAASAEAPAAQVPSIWPSIHGRLVELIRGHQTTMLFVNSRRLAERLAAAINEAAGEELAAAHHGSLARETRLEIERRLKEGLLPAIVATSSLELGIDMGSVDLVIQIEAPPSIAAGIQRVGRAGHQLGAVSRGVIFPKFRGDLLACSAAVRRMREGEVEATLYPRNPLDILAQQLVAMASLGALSVDDAYATVRGAAPFADLSRGAMENVLDLLSGRFPSDEFNELRPRLTWDRLQGEIAPRRGTQRVAIINGGTIPDRGLFGVFLADGEAGGRVGELDEEMVFETRPGDVFLLGASSWRVVGINHDRVLVIPAPGEPGKMPFGAVTARAVRWSLAEPWALFARQLVEMPRGEAERMLVGDHGLDTRAATNLLDYLHEQQGATGALPSDETIVVEAFPDEIGDWRLVVMAPFGSRVFAPWATAIAAALREEIAGQVDLTWNEDGMVFRLPASERPPDATLLFPPAEEVEEIVIRELGATALFATRFRENAARALLLPRRQAGKRTPLWLQRRRAADLLAVASRYERFPILLETYRECLRDVFDVAGLKEILAGVQAQRVKVRAVETKTPSPFAAALLFEYTGNFLYEGDAPLAERRAQSLVLDQAQLRELLGDAELRTLLDSDVIAAENARLQRLEGRRTIMDADGLHEWLLSLGDLSAAELAIRTAPDASGESGLLTNWLRQLQAASRVIALDIAGERRYAAAEDASRFRDGLGCALPEGLPAAFLEPVAAPLDDLISRFARTHVAFRSEDVAARLGIPVELACETLDRLAAAGRVVDGAFLPDGAGREWCDKTVLRTLKQKSLINLRKQVQPVDSPRWVRFLLRRQGVAAPRRGLDGLLDTIEQLQGMPLPALDLERRILPARVTDFKPEDLDELCAAGEVLWQGFETVGKTDGRIAFYLTDHFQSLSLWRPPTEDAVETKILDFLRERGASFFETLHAELGGFRNDLCDALWRLVWGGHVTNDTLSPLRSLLSESKPRKSTHRRAGKFRSRRTTSLPGTGGRWSLIPGPDGAAITATRQQAARAQQLLARYGIVTRELVSGELLPGGFAGVYPVFKAMEEAGRVRRGFFVSGQSAAQFALPGTEDELRKGSTSREQELFVLAATDPANPYGAALRWPETSSETLRPQRAAGARVILRQGRLLGYLGRTGRQLLTFLADPGADANQAAAECEALLSALQGLAQPAAAVLLTHVDGMAVSESDLAGQLKQAGFVPLRQGYRLRHIDVPADEQLGKDIAWQ